MTIYMKTKSGRYDATARFDPETRKTIVLRGARVSPNVSTSPRFKSSKAIIKLRNAYVKDGILTENLTCTSPSQAANFVGGNSQNGLDDWKMKDGSTLRSELEKRKK